MSDKGDLPEAEIAKRRDTALLRALSTPHKKQADMKVGRKAKGDALREKGRAKKDQP
jgi:hypothetical protein